MAGVASTLRKDSVNQLESGGHETSTPESAHGQLCSKRSFGCLLFSLILLIICLSIGLALRPEGNVAAAAIATEDSNSNPNLKIYNDALDILKSTPREHRELPSGEIISYREYNKGQPHNLVVLPGFMTDDTIFSILVVLPQFEDHHIIVVNPIGWNGSTMKDPIYSHEENADQVMELLHAIGVETTMVMGVSTGGGIAFHLAHKYPDSVWAAFLVHSIPLNANKFMMTSTGEVTVIENLDQVKDEYPTDPDMIYDLFRSLSSNPDEFIPKEHDLTKYLTEGAIGMPGKVEVGIANVKFNVTPIKTAFAEPSFALSSLKSKIVVIHGSNDFVNPAQLVESVTKLAIADRWAPTGMLSFYDDGAGHLVLIDNPKIFADVYRKALQDQILV